MGKAGLASVGVLQAVLQFIGINRPGATRW